MKRITKDEYLRLLKNKEVSGMEISTMKEDYTVPVIFDFVGFHHSNVHYFLTNENPELDAPAIRKEMFFDYERFLEDVRFARYTDIIILNQSSEPDWEV